MISADAIRGYIDLIVLSLLKRQPSYAYDLAKTITEVSDGEYTIKQTTLYTALKRLESTGPAAPPSGGADPGTARRAAPPSRTGAAPSRRLNSLTR